MKCDCVDTCKRSGTWVNPNGDRSSYYTPYLPDFVEGHEKQCQELPIRDLGTKKLSLTDGLSWEDLTKEQRQKAREESFSEQRSNSTINPKDIK